ncbi:DNA glycosylase [Tricharina praecox]|uniref:DNA glycosylase n=1 Tax=Tricharina praecox TaxID=43433 RepID=UPI002220CECB|nr:DNA glycosylase [Tricharina praecox]KAI5857194.1 DNA glycosylase [Tricharina praecox]
MAGGAATESTTATPGGVKSKPKSKPKRRSRSSAAAAEAEAETDDDTATATAPAAPPKGTLLQHAEAHLLSVSPSLAPLVAAHTCPLFTSVGLAEAVDPFTSLASGIISQQVSGAAARSIKAKFISLFEPNLTLESLRFPSPSLVLSLPLATLQTAGVSARKAAYLHSLATAFTAETATITPQFLATASDAEIVRELTKIHGIGQWSAEMFLMFALKRWDVFTVGDLGVQRGMAAWAGRDVNALKKAGGTGSGGKGGKSGKKWKYMAEQEMRELAEPFAPYRTLFCWYMWRCEGTDIDAMGDVTTTTTTATTTK